MSKKLLMYSLIGLILVVALVMIFNSGPKTGNVINVNDNTEDSIMEGNLIPMNSEESSFEFEGFAPGKSHLGSFEDFQVDLIEQKGKITGLNAIIQANSVNTTIDRLDNHLRSKDFFDVEKYSTIKFNSKSLDNNNLTGSLEFHGITKEITFPVEITEDSISAEFIIDTALFNMQNTFANEDVRIKFNISK